MFLNGLLIVLLQPFEFQTYKPSGARTQSPTIGVIDHQHTYQKRYTRLLEFDFSHTLIACTFNCLIIIDLNHHYRSCPTSFMPFTTVTDIYVYVLTHLTFIAGLLACSDLDWSVTLLRREWGEKGEGSEG